MCSKWSKDTNVKEFKTKARIKEFKALTKHFMWLQLHFNNTTYNPNKKKTKKKKKRIMINVNVSVKNIVCAKKIVLGILAHVFVRIVGI